MSDEPKALAPRVFEGELEGPLSPEDAWVEACCEFFAKLPPHSELLNPETQVRIIQHLPGYAPPRPFNPSPDAGDV